MTILHNIYKINTGQSIEMEPLFTPDELSEYLKVNRRTIYRMLESNELPFAFKVKGSWRFKHSDIEAWIELQKKITHEGNTE